MVRMEELGGTSPTGRDEPTNPNRRSLGQVLLIWGGVMLNC